MYFDKCKELVYMSRAASCNAQFVESCYRPTADAVAHVAVCQADGQTHCFGNLQNGRCKPDHLADGQAGKSETRTNNLM